MEEIWNINLFFKIALIEKIRSICESIYSSQIQKLKVESLITRYLESNKKINNNFKTGYGNLNVDQGGNRYQYIEFLSYKLRMYGKQGIPYLNILEEEVKKQGLTIDEVIKKEHYDIALKKVSIGNSIKSIHELQRMNFVNVFEKINEVEEILSKDPVDVYSKMDYATKEYYRNKVKEISKKLKVSETYVANLLLSKAQKKYDEGNRGKKAHIGYYLIDKGLEEIYIKSKKIHDLKTDLYIYSTLTIPILISAIIAFGIKIENFGIKILMFLLITIPISEVVIKVIQTIFGKVRKPTLIPKLDFTKGIPEKYSTMVVIPTILNNKDKVIELFEKLEVYYLGNKSENMYFTLLGDCTTSQNKNEPFDNEIENIGKEMAKKLSDKYPQSEFPRFNFIYRNRFWNGKEDAFLGWERKRGLLTQFNEYLLGNLNNVFKVNTIQEWKIAHDKKVPEIKYIITLDADTNLILNSGLELVGAMAHILNTPELNEKKVVTSGHALIQPRIGIDLLSSIKSKFTEIYAGPGGIDSYANAISDIYQDNFGEGIYTGKGIYDLKVFSQVLKNKIPENTVLSHDLLEGCYLRCGLASDIVLLDGYPKDFNSYMARLHRWIRGDLQIIPWLKNNKLNKLSKYKIIDNIRRSLIEVMAILNVILLLILKMIFNLKIGALILIPILSTIVPTILDYANFTIFKREGIKYQKSFTKKINGLTSSLYKGIVDFISLPYRFYISLNAIVKTIYRMNFSHKHLLEWVTSEEAEKNAKSDLLSYCINMWFSIALGVIVFGVGILHGWYLCIIGTLWIISPFVCWNLSRENKSQAKINLLNENEKSYVREIAKNTWKYFEDFINTNNNYLPPDNYQEDRKEKVVNRTSSTNIALGMLAVISAYDLGFIELEEAIQKIENMIEVISKLPKWNGHLYNWYNIKTLEPLIPRYVSTVDSGNFVGFLYVVKQFLEEIKNEKNQDKLQILINEITKIIENTDFKILYDEDKMLFSIGFNVEDNKMTNSYYDLLASEARQASFVAISKRDISEKHWMNLSRTMTEMNNYKGLISWSGTSFEYLMPNINIPKYPNSLIDESCRFMIKSQEQYAKKLGIPWGISEAAFNLRDLNNNYQYKAFGIPWLGLKRGLADEMVVSSYGSILAITDYPKEVIANMKKLEENEMLGEYGFYESIDYTPERLGKNKKYATVKTFMAHHQALILLSINNLFNNNILQKRFMKNPEIKALDVLLQERMPENMMITKEKKEKIEKQKYIGPNNYYENIYNKLDENLLAANVISNENYSVLINSKGEGYSKWNDIQINRFKETNDLKGEIGFFIKNIRTKRIWKSKFTDMKNEPERLCITFSADKCKFVRNDENIETIEEIIVAQNSNTEIRKITLKNNSNIDEILEVTNVFEPILSKKEDDYSHKLFNNFGLRFEYLDSPKGLLISRKQKNRDKTIYLATGFYTELNNSISELEFETNGNLVEKYVENSIPFSNVVTKPVEPVVALRRTVKIKANEKIVLSLVMTVNDSKEEATNELKRYEKNENIDIEIELARARAEEEAKYLRLNNKQLLNCQRMLVNIIFNNPTQRIYMNKLAKTKHKQDELWKYGISGDNPIILTKIKNVEDMYLVREVLKIYDYYRAKNLKIDLVFLDEENNSYEKHTREAIFQEISNSQLLFLLNSRIFVIDEFDNIDIFVLTANIILDAGKGSVKSNLDEIQELYIDTIKKPVYDKKENMIETIYEQNNNFFNIENLKYYNEYGGFTEEGNEYRIKGNEFPTVWSNIIGNEKFGSLITNNLGGYTWYKNSRLNRLSAWANSTVIDESSEAIYFKDKDNQKSWKMGNTEKSLIYGYGYTKIFESLYGINIENEIFVPMNDSVKINLIKLKNQTPQKRTLKILYYIKPVLGEDEIKTNGYINLKFNKNANLISAESLYGSDISKIMFVSSNEQINSYTGNKTSFIGKGDINNPDGIDLVSLTNENALGNSSCLAIQTEIEIFPYESKEFILLLGEGENEVDIQDMAYKYSDIKKCKIELNEVKRFWNEILGKIKVKTPSESMNLMLNGRLLYQTIMSRLWAKTALYQSGGAVGFRDQLQDVLALKYIKSDMVRKQIILQASHQFLEGDVEHWWHNENGAGIRTKFSDDLLWLPYVLNEYLQATNDYEILKEEVNYITGKTLENELEDYNIHEKSKIKGSILEHCLKAIDKSLNFGENGLPKIGSGDWNDGFSNIGVLGKGESVWLGFFIYNILEKFENLLKEIDKEKWKDKILFYEETRKNLKRNLNTNAWDGRWYKRAFMDDGTPIGSIENDECKIDSISQAWAVISNAGDNDKKYISMESFENHLVDREVGIIKLLDPAFDKTNINPGYIKMYPPGIRENGGQYTHAAIWAIIAETMLGFGDKAFELYRMINPIEHAKTKDEANKYKVEPYVMAADVYSSNDLLGRGGWTWYTGSASWYYNAGIENILGFKIKKGKIEINPCIPKDWKEYEIDYKYKNTEYKIKVKNLNGKNTGIEKIFVDEKEQNEIILEDDRRQHTVEVYM